MRYKRAARTCFYSSGILFTAAVGLLVETIDGRVPTPLATFTEVLSAAVFVAGLVMWIAGRHGVPETPARPAFISAPGWNRHVADRVTVVHRRPTPQARVCSVPVPVPSSLDGATTVGMYSSKVATKSVREAVDDSMFLAVYDRLAEDVLRDNDGPAAGAETVQ